MFDKNKKNKIVVKENTHNDKIVVSPINSASKQPNKITRWFFGVIKEFQRIQWMSFKSLLQSLLVVIIITALIVALFAVVDAIFLGGHILGV